MTKEGYIHPLYAESFSDIGTPLYLPKSKGWLIKRQIPGTNDFDAMGPYPLFFCERWDLLIEDIQSLENEVVTVTMVIPPLFSFPHERFQHLFELFRAYKCHYILDYSKPLKQAVSSSRRKDARRALRTVRVEIESTPGIDVREWHHLYSILIKHHEIRGIRSFSYHAFENQLAIPNTYFFKAIFNDKVIGGNIYYLQDGIVYYHLSALTDEGYQKDASYALKWAAIKYFKGKANFMNLGGGTAEDENEILSGLDQFKKGWSNTIQRSYLCGKIMDQKKYQYLMELKKNKMDWFPAYRSGDY